mgnify:CR=1 FL=1
MGEGEHGGGGFIGGTGKRGGTRVSLCWCWGGGGGGGVTKVLAPAGAVTRAIDDGSIAVWQAGGDWKALKLLQRHKVF